MILYGCEMKKFADIVVKYIRVFVLKKADIFI